MNEKSWGYIIIIVSVVLMFAYFAWFFAPALGSAFAWLAPYSEWSYKLLLHAVVYVALFFVLWIGYTIATTPHMTPLDQSLDENT